MLTIKGLEHFGENDYIPPDMESVVKLLELVELNFKSEQAPGFYANQIEISLKRLNKHTKFYVGMTVDKVIKNRIHEEAMKMLSMTTLSVKDITYTLGVSDPSWFSRRFKKYTGYPPKEWREYNHGIA